MTYPCSCDKKHESFSRKICHVINPDGVSCPEIGLYNIGFDKNHVRSVLLPRLIKGILPFIPENTSLRKCVKRDDEITSFCIGKRCITKNTTSQVKVYDTHSTILHKDSLGRFVIHECNYSIIDETLQSCIVGDYDCVMVKDNTRIEIVDGHNIIDIFISAHRDTYSSESTWYSLGVECDNTDSLIKWGGMIHSIILECS